MPGVPSGRGCEACRKQKKKCDQTKPRCSRCTRLDIPCVGSGEQRYKFKEHSLVLKQSRTREGEVPAIVFRHSPSNQTSRVIGEFIHMLEVEDTRYDVACYGIFLHMIPSRLGRSEALDTAASAVCKNIRAYQTKTSNKPEALGSYVRALSTLRASLMDPAKAHSIDTLLAIYMTMICQGWMDCNRAMTPNHGEGMAIILNAATQRGMLPDLGLDIAYTMAIVVVMESITNPRIPLQPWLDQLLRIYTPDGKELGRDCDESLRLAHLARVPELVREPLAHMHEIKTAYLRARNDFHSARDRLARITKLFSTAEKKQPITHLRLLVGYQTAYGIFLTLGLIFGSMVLANEPADEDSIALELATFRREVVTLSDVVREHRPLGASHMMMALTAAWATAEDPVEKYEFWALMDDFQRDFPEQYWHERGHWVKERIESIRVYRRSLSPPSEISDAISANISVIDEKGLCTVM